MRILLVGKNSFIGKNYFNYSVYCDINEVDSVGLVPENLDFSHYDVVIHLAAIVHQSKKINLSQYLEVNAELPVRVARKAKNDGVPHFIFLSTTKVYGDKIPPQGYWDEDSECNPTDSYGISKLKAEKALLELADQTFTVSILRTPMVYGSGVKANMLALMKWVLKFPILPFKGVSARRSITFVGNLAGFIDRIIEKKAQGVFIAQDSAPVTAEEIVKNIAKSANQRIRVVSPGSFLLYFLKKLLPGYYHRLYAPAVVSNNKTLLLLDFEPPYSTADGIETMVKNFIENAHGR